MVMGVDNLLGQRCRGRFYTFVISQFRQKLVSRGGVALYIPRIGRAREIWDKVFFKLRVYFDGLVSRKKVLLDYIQLIETHLDVVVEVIKVHMSVSLELCIDEEFI